MNAGNVNSRCGNVAAFALAGTLALVLVPSAQATVVDLGGGTTEITTADGLNTYKNNEVRKSLGTFVIVR